MTSFVKIQTLFTHFHYTVIKTLWTGEHVDMYVYSNSSVFPMYLHILFIYYVSWCLFSKLCYLILRKLILVIFYSAIVMIVVCQSSGGSNLMN